MIKVFTVDDHEIYLKGINALIDMRPGMKISASAGTASQLIELLPAVDVDIILLDLQLPDMEPDILLDTIREIKPSIPILYHTLMRGTRYLHKLINKGVQGYLLKNANETELYEAITTVANGGNFFTPEIDITDDHTDEYRRTYIIPDSKIASALTRREMEILNLVCAGKSNTAIAAKLFLSTSTVNTHRKNIMYKVGVSNVVDLLKFAIKHNLI
jgi:DNA-binding NarL/FixJ family response regulator